MNNFPKRLLAHALPVFSGLIFTHGSAIAQENTELNNDDHQSNELEHVQVSGETYRGLDSQTTQPVTVLTGDELAQRRQGTLGETLNALPGVHLDNFGAGASRPVIRGQTVPRIEVLMDGANVFDASSVSPDHAIVTDPLLLDAIEVLRGPAATRYGGGAINGAVNLVDSKVPRAVPEGGVSGATEVRLGSGDGEQTAVGRMTMGLGNVAFHVEGSSRESENYDIPSEFGADELADSFSESSNFSLGASWINDKGYIGAAYTRQDAEYGLPGHSHLNGVCHTHGADLHCEAHDEFEDPFGSSDDHTAYIDLRSERVDVRADYAQLLPGIAHTRMRLSYTDYEHEEIDGPSLFSQYLNEVYDARLEFTHEPLLGFSGIFGVQYTDGTFSGLDVNLVQNSGLITSIYMALTSYGPPIEYKTENYAVFLNESRSFGQLDVEFAIRKDHREISRPVPELIENVRPGYEMLLPVFVSLYGENWIDNFRDEAAEDFIENNPGSKHSPLSASFATTWNFDEAYSASVSIGRTERAPNVRELYAYGNNLATNSYELGLTQRNRASSSFPENSADIMESADSLDLTFRKTSGDTQFEVGVFYQDVTDYIFARHLETEDATGVAHNYLMYVAADADFTGIDGQISHQFSPVSRVTVFGDYVDADLKSEDDRLPRMPPGRLGVRYDWESGPFAANLEYYRTASQDRVASYETPTDGYNMANMTISYQFNNDATEAYLRGVNLTNELAFMHTSFVKEQSPLRGRNLILGLRHQF
ncbi:TonB-dependent receptor domain-containing protein [Microbulbifer elongatus]|uniref:TonB-dependent receptor domain-containing protein n=1 Tax=Microbulbifer elongatus TaxID=86173 RepID=UPI001E2ACB91|nr:TonB-dependent receptor [Microbulbifer elongatus]